MVSFNFKKTPFFIFQMKVEMLPIIADYSLVFNGMYGLIESNESYIKTLYNIYGATQIGPTHSTKQWVTFGL